MSDKYHQIGKRGSVSGCLSGLCVWEYFNREAYSLAIKIVEKVAQENSKGFVFCFHFGGYWAMRRKAFGFHFTI